MAFQKIIVHMLKVQMDHKQKIDERQQRMEEQRVQQQKKKNYKKEIRKDFYKH